MKMETVIEAVNKLSTNYESYTAQELKDSRVKLLMESFKHKLDSSLKTAVDRVIRDENIKKFPTVMQIENYMPVIHNQHQEFCDRCERTGYFNVWQYRESIGKHYDIAYRCPCNTTTMQNIRVLDAEMIPIRAHNPFPPSDPRHKDYDSKKENWNYQRLDTEEFKALCYSHKMKNVLKSVN